MSEHSPSDLRGLVDMGSNGIRYSITNLRPDTARSLPVIFQERIGISLYDAQYSTGTKGPISQDVIDEVITGLKRFQAVCADFEIPNQNIKVLATEATRTAVNSEDYRKQIRNATGWEVDMLAKEDEGRIGALGIASSFEKVEGLVMDLGGGSTQLTWMIYDNGTVTTSPKGSVSFPYGAAAMTQLLSRIDQEKHSKQARADLQSKIKDQYTEALQSLELPATLQQKVNSRNMTLYLSGGGFRGWGYILMSKSKKGPYPIPIINGFQAQVKDFSDIDTIKTTAEDDASIFRVSKRRAAQVPAVAFLVQAVTDAFPFIKDVRFCQGGVREGYLFNELPSSTKSQSPLSAATSPFAIDTDSAAFFASLLAASLPTNSAAMDRWHPTSLTPSLLRAIADTMYVQSNSPKESASLSALYLPITGVLSVAHGISHTDRALLGLALCRRWNGDIPPPHDDFLTRLQCLISSQEAWWARYLGAIAALIGDVYPAGRRVKGEKSRVEIESVWAEGLGKKGNQQGVRVRVRIVKGAIVGNGFVRDHVEAIEDLGKKKNRVGGKEYGFGVPVRVDVEWMG